MSSSSPSSSDHPGRSDHPGPSETPHYSDAPAAPPAQGQGATPAAYGQGSAPRRRALLTAGLGGAALSALGAQPAAAGPSPSGSLPVETAAPGRVAGAAADAGPPVVPRGPGAWHRYVQGPRDRTVRPVRILSSSGDVRRPDALLAPGGPVTVLHRPEGSDGRPPSVTLDFGKVVVGRPRVRFAWASGNRPGVRLAFSETREYLTARSDFTRADQAGGTSHGTDQYAVPAEGADWLDTKGFSAGGKVYADGLHGFRYLRLTLDAVDSDAPAALPWGTVAVDSVSLEFTAYLGTPETYRGWFLCSDDELNRYWYGAAYTGELTTDVFRRDDVDPRGAWSPGLDGKLVLHDGPKRDRDPYVGDLAVSGRTLYLTHDDAAEAARNVLADLAAHQRADGWIPPASIDGYTLPLFDYPLWWVMCGWDYVLYTGDRDYAARHHRHLVRLLDGWCPRVTDGAGLLSKGLGGTADYGDYAFLDRTGRVTYYNAAYVQALRDAARSARLLGRDADARRWSARAEKVARAVDAHLWDAAAGAYLDSASGPVRHAQDGNALAVTSGIASPGRAHSALDHLGSATQRRWGNAFMDNDTLFEGASQRVYAFTSYPETVARFVMGRADEALGMIRRCYGWMDRHDPGTTHWEGIGPKGVPYEKGFTSMAHGWSTGVVPALTNQLLGAAPTAPGYAEWEVRPHPGSVRWAEGRLPTPHGPLTVRWDNGPAAFVLTVHAPAGTRGTVSLPAGGDGSTLRSGDRLLWDGERARAAGVRRVGDRVTVTGLGGGTHALTLDSPPEAASP